LTFPSTFPILLNCGWGLGGGISISGCGTGAAPNASAIMPQKASYPSNNGKLSPRETGCLYTSVQAWRCPAKSSATVAGPDVGVVNGTENGKPSIHTPGSELAEVDDGG